MLLYGKTYHVSDLNLCGDILRKHGQGILDVE